MPGNWHVRFLEGLGAGNGPLPTRQSAVAHNTDLSWELSMGYLDFYTEIREVGDFKIDLFNGKGYVEGVVTERWQELLARTITCGDTYRRRIQSRLGMERSEHEELAATVTGKLGLAGLGSFESMIQGKVATEVRFQVEREWEDQYEFRAPECGRKVIKLYQQQRRFDLNFEDTRAFRRGSWSRSIVTWLDRVHDGSRAIRRDPLCDCPDEEDPNDAVGRFVARLGHMSVLVEATTDGKYAYLRPLNARVLLENLPTSQGAEVKIRLEQRMVPSYLRFLGGDESQSWTATLSALQTTEQEKEAVLEADTMADVAG